MTAACTGISVALGLLLDVKAMSVKRLRLSIMRYCTDGSRVSSVAAGDTAHMGFGGTSDLRMPTMPQQRVVNIIRSSEAAVSLCICVQLGGVLMPLR